MLQMSYFVVIAGAVLIADGCASHGKATYHGPTDQQGDLCLETTTALATAEPRKLATKLPVGGQCYGVQKATGEFVWLAISREGGVYGDPTVTTLVLQTAQETLHLIECENADGGSTTPFTDEGASCNITPDAALAELNSQANPPTLTTCRDAVSETALEGEKHRFSLRVGALNITIKVVKSVHNAGLARGALADGSFEDDETTTDGDGEKYDLIVAQVSGLRPVVVGRLLDDDYRYDVLRAVHYHPGSPKLLFFIEGNDTGYSEDLPVEVPLSKLGLRLCEAQPP